MKKIFMTLCMVGLIFGSYNVSAYQNYRPKKRTLTFKKCSCSRKSKTRAIRRLGDNSMQRFYSNKKKRQR